MCPKQDQRGDFQSLIPIRVDRREDDRKEEVIRVLVVENLDSPIPSPSELPSTPFASSLVSGSSAPAQCRMLL